MQGFNLEKGFSGKVSDYFSCLVVSCLVDGFV